jgi:signal transduction histidine kinase
MNLALLSPYLPLGFTALYTFLLLYLLSRNNQPRQRQTRWFFGFVAAVIVWNTAYYFIPNEGRWPNAGLVALTASTTLLAAATAIYVAWPRYRHWLTIGLVGIVAGIVLDTIAPRPLLTPGGSLEGRVSFYPSAGAFLFLGVWLFINVSLLLQTWRDYRRTRLPWHANRLLHWDVFLFIIAISQLATLLTSLRWVVALGQLLCFLGVVGLARAIVSHRLFDVRARMRRVIGFLLIAVASAVPASIVLALTSWLSMELGLRPVQSYLAGLLVIATGFLLYQPFRRFIERVVYRYLLGQEFHTSTVVRAYSQAISRTLDVEQLAQVIIGTIGELLQTTRGALMLVSKSGAGHEVEVIPSLHHHSHPQRHFAKDSLFIQALRQERRPILQYDIDFSPLFHDIVDSERDWLAEQGAEVYVPILNGSELAGLIALGPKRSGLAYRANELELVQVLAEQTVIALQNALLYSELNRQNDHIRNLNSDLRRQNERLEILDRIKSDFITIASHELRTPLTQVKGYADILSSMNEEAPLSQKETREIVGHICRASSRLEALITAMLDASQLEVAGMELTFQRTRLEVIVQLAVEPLLDALQQRHIHLEMIGLGDLPPIQADFKRLVQALHNIIGNAIKYTPDYGNILISAQRQPGAGNREFLEVTIADSGIGIDSQYHELIFEKFFRIGNPELHSTGSTKFKGAGPGLGLHIAKGVIEAHGGHIWVESEGEDEEHLPGSHFHIILPLSGPLPDNNGSTSELLAEQKVIDLITS